MFLILLSTESAAQGRVGASHECIPPMGLRRPRTSLAETPLPPY